MTANYLWILDNGHGKATIGKRSPCLADGRQLLEYEFNRDIVNRLIVKLETAGYSYHNLVPEIEKDISLTERVIRANNLSGNLPKIYLSVHSNAAVNNGWCDASGIETYCYKSEGKSGKIATVFQQKLIESLGWKDRKVKTANFYVLKKTTMPSVLTETGFYTDPKEVLKLLDNDWREKIAEAHFQAIKFIEINGINT